MKKISKHAVRFDHGNLQELFNSGSRKDFVAQVRHALRQLLVKLQVEGHYDEVITLIKREPCYRELNNTWETIKPTVRRQKWHDLIEDLIQIAYATRP